MAIVRHLARNKFGIQSKHTEVKATYMIVRESTGERFLQIDTYGSKQRKLLNKKSQSMRFSRAAIRELKRILTKL